ncbi:MAG: response regulator transcription factor [Saccharofermentans sp.]|nr:response regulator transcription factor [Saccharofermentans sp.]
MYTIFLSEDDNNIADLIEKSAASWDFKIYRVHDFHEVIHEFELAHPQLVLMDIRLPFFNGYHWCSEIRKISNVPIIFISSVSDNLNQVMAMNMGADDFIAKPFEMDLLMTKIMALLRRTYDLTVEERILSAKGAVLNTSDDTLEYEGKKIALSQNEYKIIYTLMENKGKIVSRARLMEKLWEGDEFVDENALSVNINRLRKKLDAEGLTDLIVTRHKAGYMIGESDAG